MILIDDPVFDGRFAHGGGRAQWNGGSEAKTDDTGPDLPRSLLSFLDEAAQIHEMLKLRGPASHRPPFITPRPSLAVWQSLP